MTARNNVSLGRETLRHALGLGGPLDFDIVDALEQPPIEVDDAEALALAYEHRPELRSIRAQVDAAAQRVAAVESIRVADKGLQQARENLEIAEGRYRTDVGNIIELTDAQTSLTSADASRVQAVVNYRTALASLERATAHPFSAE